MTLLERTLFGSSPQIYSWAKKSCKIYHSAIYRVWLLGYQNECRPTSWSPWTVFEALFGEKLHNHTPWTIVDEGENSSRSYTLSKTANWWMLRTRPPRHPMTNYWVPQTPWCISWCGKACHHRLAVWMHWLELILLLSSADISIPLSSSGKLCNISRACLADSRFGRCSLGTTLFDADATGLDAGSRRCFCKIKLWSKNLYGSTGSGQKVTQGRATEG